MPVKGTLNFTARSPDRPIGSPPGTIQLSEELSNKIRIYQRAKHNNETICQIQALWPWASNISII